MSPLDGDSIGARRVSQGVEVGRAGRGRGSILASFPKRRPKSAPRSPKIGFVFRPFQVKLLILWHLAGSFWEKILAFLFARVRPDSDFHQPSASQCQV